MKTGIVTDQKDVGIFLGQKPQAVHQLFSGRCIEPVLDHPPRTHLELGKDEIEGFPRSPRTRAQNEIGYTDRTRKMPGDAAGRLTPALAQPPLMILDVILPAGLGMAQQVQHMHSWSPPGVPL